MEAGEERAHPLVSVVVPVRDGRSTIVDQLDGLFLQDAAFAWELVVSDNGSTDGTVTDVVRPSVHRSPVALKIVDSSDRPGAAGARNAGAAVASGGWLAFCDADDVASPGWLRELVEASCGSALVGGPYDGRRLNPRSRLRWRAATVMTELPRPMEFLPFALSGNLLIERAVFEALGGFDESLPASGGGEDVDLSWRAQLSGARLAYAPAAVMHWRLRSTPCATGRQVAAFAESQAFLYRRYRSLGARRRRTRAGLADVLYCSLRLPYVFMGPARAGLWFVRAGQLVGRWRGGVKYRVFFP